jgi:preprotein translocase subunit SecF
MSEGLYSRLIDGVGYRKLILIPPVIALLMLGVVLVNGLEYGIDFRGGTWIDALTGQTLEAGQLLEIESKLAGHGLEDVKAHVGYDIDTGQNKLTIQTTTVVSDKEKVKEEIGKYTGELTEFDTATVALAEKPPIQLKERLAKRLGQGLDVDYADGPSGGGTLTVRGLDLEKNELDSALTYYTGEQADADLMKKNFNMRSVGPTLGATFRQQGFKALFVALALMGVVVFMAFKDPIPSIAVIQAAVCDVLIAVGGMSLLGIPMEPASLAALLMLIGYSVDTDIMLTARTLKEKTVDFADRMEDAMKTGLTMTGTTLAVMGIVYIISNTLTQITTLSAIASVLLIGLVADLATTWFTNAGILRWYLEVPGRKLKILGRRR